VLIVHAALLHEQRQRNSQLAATPPPRTDDSAGSDVHKHFKNHIARLDDPNVRGTVYNYGQ
jgi:hypothetical protein